MPKYVDENGREQWTRIVYVIGLSREACSRTGSPCGGTSCGRIPVYVGETAHTAEQRFDQHKAGENASKWVRDFGISVRAELAKGYEDLGGDSRVSQAAEAELADKLRADGRYCVYGGH